MATILATTVTCVYADTSHPAPEGSHKNAYFTQAEAATDLINYALSLVGVHYRFGGDRPATGLDCSGLVKVVFHHVDNILLPHNARLLSHEGEPVNIHQLRPGDLLFFHMIRHAINHVGIYIGHNQFIHAPGIGQPVQVASLHNSFWMRHFGGARRILDTASINNDKLR
ncbi:MAG: C40 family peptidase [Proteobacteria bacterium]|nr:C40 family peptidase [Pseudomonadota bacterium]MDE3208902.1 C40 family peptidase [Pseudomonadota bacterium]